MTREERNEYNYIKRYEKDGVKLSYGTTLTIRTNASREYKTALDALYTKWGFHPASVRVDAHMYDENERIIYIYGQTYQNADGYQCPWTDLYFPEEIERFANALL